MSVEAEQAALAERAELLEITLVHLCDSIDHYLNVESATAGELSLAARQARALVRDV